MHTLQSKAQPTQIVVRQPNQDVCRSKVKICAFCFEKISKTPKTSFIKGLV